MSSLDKKLCQALLAGEATGSEISALISQGASPNASEAGMPALHWAARNGLVDAVTVLLAHAADVESRSTNAGSDGTPLHATLWIGATDDKAAPIVRALLAAGASPVAANASGEVPLHLAAERGLVEVIDALAPVTPLATRTANGQTALERALVQSKVPAAVRLVVHGAPIDDACMERANQPRVRELLETTRSTGTPPVSAFTSFACVLAEHITDGPALNAELSGDEVQALLDRLATTLGDDVGAALDHNDDVDHFQEEFGDDWLGELIDSYWEHAHEETVRTAWTSLPAAIQAALPLDERIDEMRARFEAAVRAHE